MNRALRISAAGVVEAVHVDTSKVTFPDEMNELLGSDWYDLASSFGSGVELYYDMYGADRGTPVNGVASMLLHQAGHPMIVHGPIVFLGTDEQGSPAGLSDAQTAAVVSAWCAATAYPPLTNAAALLG
ncbi:DUF3846 domain-containing protein [Plantibacter sp. CFBP 13570]|uniref:DUF3846 domain-containing protein n=1 Tax=Plantibacter sp. CFBP 13570 TaxID=2775272 RepID=UPI00193092C8|nr:hypothetical protein [Plantibacter sp. CFBP 13570]MBD8535691.1 hypothetical protein [Plantibacter sp. CFBP 13570]